MFPDLKSTELTTFGTFPMKQWTTSQVMPPGRRALRPALPALQAAAVPALDGLHCAVGDHMAVVEFLLEKGVALISSDFVFFSISMGTGFPWISHLRFLFKVPLKFKSRDFGACLLKIRV